MRCKATVRRTGEQCKSPAIKGGEVCRMHGGAARQVRAAAERRRAEKLAADLWGGRRDVHPASALLELVGWKSSEVEYWRHRVHEIQQDDEDGLTWGVTREKTGGEDFGTTQEAKPHIALTLLHKAEADLAAYCAAALKAGVDEAMVRIAQATAGQFRAVLALVLEDERLGVTAAGPVIDQVVADALTAGIEGVG